MARLRAGEDITRVSAAPAPAQPAGKAPPAQPAPAKENVAFDELGGEIAVCRGGGGYVSGHQVWSCGSMDISCVRFFLVLVYTSWIEVL